jgi:hypothetical protein
MKKTIHSFQQSFWEHRFVMSIFNRSLFRLIATKEVLKYFRLFSKSLFSSRIKFWCLFIKPLLGSLVTYLQILFSLNVYFPFYSQKYYYFITNFVKVQKVDKVVVLFWGSKLLRWGLTLQFCGLEPQFCGS